LVGFLLALATLGLDLTRITVLLSALGLGIGFGLQQIMNNFVSGLILLFERPVQVGDSIQLGDLGGEVLRIGTRSSPLRTPPRAQGGGGGGWSQTGRSWRTGPPRGRCRPAGGGSSSTWGSGATPTPHGSSPCSQPSPAVTRE